MPGAVGRKRKAPPSAREFVDGRTYIPAADFDALNLRANCAWQVVHPNKPARSPDIANPHEPYEFTKKVTISLPQACPGDVCVFTLNDGFVADDGAFVWPNSLYTFCIPEHCIVRGHGCVCMACNIPVVSWHKRNDPVDGRLAWVYTDYAHQARVTSVAVYAAQEGSGRIMELYTAQQTISVREDDDGCILWPEGVELKRSLLGMGRQDMAEIGTTQPFREWMLQRAQARNNSSFSKVRTHTDNEARLSTRPGDGHLNADVRDATNRAMGAWSFGTIESNSHWKELDSGNAVVWRPPTAHQRATSAFAIAGQVCAQRTQFCIWSDAIVAIWFHAGPGLREAVNESAYLMRVDYLNPEREKKHMVVGFGCYDAVNSFLRKLEPIPTCIDVYTQGAALTPARRSAVPQPVAPPSAAASDDPHPPPPAERDSRNSRSALAPIAAPVPAPAPTPAFKPPRPKMGGPWLGITMPVGKFLTAASHPFTELELFQLRNQNAMKLVLPKYRHACPGLPKIDEFNFEAEVIDKILGLPVHPAIECYEPKRVWKQNVVDALNCHWYTPSAHEVKRTDPYSIDNPWSKLVAETQKIRLDICVGLDGGPLHPVLDRMQLHNLLATRKEQQDAIEKRREAIRKWDEVHAEVFETQAEISYEEAFRRRDKKLRRENMVVID